MRSFFRREPKQSRSRALVDAVVEATDELIRDGAPIDGVTVENVSARAGVGMGSFYEYFTGKDSLIGALVAKVTRSNFEVLTRKLDAIEAESLDELVRAFARITVHTYLAHPNRTRVIIEGIGRLRLQTLVHEEKDRFARVMAERASRFLPGAPLGEIEITMRFLADAALGVIGFGSIRGKIDEDRIAEDLAWFGIETLRRRHHATNG